MKHTTQSMLLATLLLASGFASAQSSTVPLTRADVKSQIGTGEAKAGTQGGSGPSPAQTAAPGNMPNSRADVKAEAMTGKGTAGIQGGSAATPADNMNTKNLNQSTTAERKAKRDERRAKAKAKRDGAMKTGSTPPAPVSGIAR